ncbi:HAD family hydrolase [Haliea sp. E17]|uniref:HAD family hydrolase n=1 Tax=Haliea sp. E17 TaxID=3401576 RepID=UPI003AAAFA02
MSVFASLVRKIRILPLLCLLLPVLAWGDEPLASWQDGGAKTAIIAFVEKVSDTASPGFVPAEQRIATFDNDGTLWSEQPLYFQGIWALDQIRKMAPSHPEWQQQEPFKSALAGDIHGMLAGGEGPLLKMLMVPHANVTAHDFASEVSAWLVSARHPTTGMQYTDMVFQPMLELMDYLRANDFKVYIVSGGGIDFIRVFAEQRYGVPPEQVIGSTADARFEMRDGVPTIVKEGKITLVDDKAGKPVGIYRHIGRRPIFAAGNSDGDMQMLEYTTIAEGPDDKTPRFGLIVHHTDGEREFAYDRQSAMGKLDKALDAAPEQGWLVVDMKKDWKQVYPPAQAD